MRVRVVNGFQTLLSTIPKEIYGMLIQIGFIGVVIYHIGLYRSNFFQRTIEKLRIHLHSTGIQHGTQQRIFLLYLLAQQHGDTQQLERWNGNQLDRTPIANAFGHRYANSQAGIRTRSATHSYAIKRNQMTIYER